MIPRFRPSIGLAEFLALFRVRRNAVQEFEREFASRMGVSEAVAFPYGRSALWAFLRAVGIRDADIIIPAYTCSVVAHAIALSGNRPKFVDIRLTDYNMDLDALADAIDENTRAIVPTHIFGYALDMGRVETIVRDAESRYGHKIWIIEDCAHSFGASRDGRLVGTYGDTALYGLNISKIITSIFGGMLTFRDEGLAAKIRIWRDAEFQKPGLLKPWLRRLYLLATFVAFNERVYGFTWWLQTKTPLLNRLTKAYHLDDKIHFPPDHLDRMLDVEASVGLVQLEKYGEIVAQRQRNAAWYDEHLPERDDWTLPPIVDGATYSHYVIRTNDRRTFLEACAKHQVELGQLIDYSVPDLDPYKVEEQCPNSRVASETVINLPLSIPESRRQMVLDAIGHCP